MILSTKGRYAVMAMVDLAARKAQGPVTLAAISERQEIPLAYLEQIFAKLKRMGLVTSVRGPGGGYALSAPAGEISIARIVLASEEPIKMTRCGGEVKACMSDKTRCLTHDLWEGLSEHIHSYLDNITLADVCARRIADKFPREKHLPETAGLFAEPVGGTMSPR
jgi:Rrf2 family iron-sulfur cluster assembly transcriptional regulator